MAYREYSSADEMMAAYRAMRRPPPPVVPLARVDPKSAAAAKAAQQARDYIRHLEVARPVAELSATLFFLMLAASRQHKNARAEYAVWCVSRETGIPIDDIMGKSRKFAFAQARKLAYAAVSAINPHWSLPSIGRFFGRDHTTILYGLRSGPRAARDQYLRARDLERSRRREARAAALPPGAPRQHHRAKLDVQTVVEVKCRLLAGETLRSIAASVGVNPRTIRRIKCGRNWGWVPWPDAGARLPVLSESA